MRNITRERAHVYVQKSKRTVRRHSHCFMTTEKLKKDAGAAQHALGWTMP